MPHKHTRWSCNRCRKRFATFREAETCEIGHIADTTLQDFKAALESITAKGKTQ